MMRRSNVEVKTIWIAFIAFWTASALLSVQAFAPLPSRRISTYPSTRRYISQPPLKDETKTLHVFPDTTLPSFNPFDLPENSVDKINIALHVEEQKTNEENKLGIWAARGLLLLVAAIWGTNFAVRLFGFGGIPSCYWGSR